MLTQCNLEINVSLLIINGAMLVRRYASAHKTFFMLILNTIYHGYIYIVYVRAVAIILNILLRYL